ncbi:hypothetical protein HanIR_Chr03g0143021 [Helianthus annuus]|nr:hypothetical protein HanIR_Chr03g0143021 [Helianthus annuus]
MQVKNRVGSGYLGSDSGTGMIRGLRILRVRVGSLRSEWQSERWFYSVSGGFAAKTTSSEMVN